MNSTLPLVHIGRDSWERPVYESNGQLYVDVDPRSSSPPAICTKMNNNFNGEPDTPISVMKRFENVEIKFSPKRDVWR